MQSRVLYGSIKSTNTTGSRVLYSTVVVATGSTFGTPGAMLPESKATPVWVAPLLGAVVLGLALSSLFTGPDPSVAHNSPESALAQFELALQYAKGEGKLSQSHANAVHWFEKAAEQDHAGAQINLGHMYFQGAGVPQSLAKARHWYGKAVSASGNSAESLYFLGTAFDEEGNDLAAAALYYRKAAEAGSTQAMCSLGQMHELGEGGVEQNFQTARKLYERASGKGDAHASYLLGSMYEDGDRGTRKDFDEARRLYRLSADKDDMAAFRLGHMFSEAVGVEKSYARAKKWFKKSAFLGNAQAQLELGTLYAKGQGVRQSWKDAGYWFKKAAAQDVSQAAVHLGFMYRDGKGIAQDYAKAKVWFEQGAESNHVDAVHALGLMWDLGQGVIPTLQRAMHYYRRAGNLGHVQSQQIVRTVELREKNKKAQAAQSYP